MNLLAAALMLLAPLADFGIEPIDETVRRQFVITCSDGLAHSYLHHEQIEEGSKEGVILCELLTGQPPITLAAGRYKVKESR